MVALFRCGLAPLSLLLFLTFSCSSAEKTAERASGSVTDSDEQAVAAAEQNRQNLQRLEELYWSRTEASRQNFVQADVDFMADMIVHHAQALIMSRLAPQNDASPQVQRLAARILSAQEDEIELMQQWLKDRGQDVPHVRFDGIDMFVDVHRPGDSHSGHEDVHTSHRDDDRNRNYQQQHDHHTGGHHGHGHDMDHHHDMPGMLTQEQLEEMEAARGEEFDRLFLSYMIEHHEGAVIMVRDLFATEGAALDAESYRLAVDIYAEQVTEINMMRLMLTERGHPVPPSIIPGGTPDADEHPGHDGHHQHSSDDEEDKDGDMHEHRHQRHH